ncbi:MAG TPA: hypothetical protein VH722_01070 [Alphaproteobacteria bacterium]|jgi:hypothetical protein|nr:hypothetical protein [Alphaproteobacteria bacterium]
MTEAPRKRIGIDFDNTIICYDAVFLSAAIARGLVPGDFTGGKRAVRDAIRLLSDGELTWQRLQGHVYGQGIAGATMFGGLDDFLQRCRRAGHSVVIVSHKTEYGHFDPARVNLREAALGWMRGRGFFADDGFAIRREDIHFEGSRAEKLERIAALGCTHFIDDLREVLDDPDFPSGVERILFAGDVQRSLPYPAFAQWSGLADALLGASQ